MSISDICGDALSILLSFWNWYADIVSNHAPINRNEIAIVITSLFLVMTSSITLGGVMLWRKPAIFLDKVLFCREIGIFCLLATTFISFYFRWTNLYLRSSFYIALAIIGFLLIAALIKENTMSSEEVENERRRSFENKQDRNEYREDVRREKWEANQ